MKKLVIILLYLTFASSLYAQESPSFTVDAGVMSRDSNGRVYLKERGFKIPYKVGLMYGVAISSNPPSEFRCFIEVQVPSNSLLEVNGDRCTGCSKTVKKIDVSSHEIESGMNIVKSETATCRNNLLFLEKLTEEDIPGKRIVKYRVNNEPEKVLVFDVFEP